MKLPTEKSSASFQKLLEDGVFVWNCLKTWLTESFNSKKFYSNISFVNVKDPQITAVLLTFIKEISKPCLTLHRNWFLQYFWRNLKKYLIGNFIFCAVWNKNIYKYNKMNSSNQIFSITLRSVFRTLLNISNDAFLPE